MKKIKNEVYRDSSKIVDRIEDILLIFEDENQAKILKVHPWILRDKNNKPKKKGIIVDVDILEPQNINWDERQKIHLQIRKALCDRLHKFAYKYYETNHMNAWEQNGFNISGTAMRFKFTKRIL